MSTELVAVRLGASSHTALALERAAIEFGIVTPLQKAHWLAQLAHESGSWRYVREIWGPTAAQKRYEGRTDLGNTQPGDGKRYMGRGFIQITGRANYREAGKALGLDLISRPDLAETVDNAARIAGWYWRKRGINAHAERDDLIAVTKAINGGTNGITDRARWLERAKAEFRKMGAQA